MRLNFLFEIVQTFTHILINSVTIISCLRLNELLVENEVGITKDPTFVLVGSAFWSVFEINLAIICACLPSMRPLLRLIVHGSLTPTRSNNTPGSSFQRRQTGSRVSRALGSKTFSGFSRLPREGRFQKNSALSDQTSGSHELRSMGATSSHARDSHLQDFDQIVRDADRQQGADVAYPHSVQAQSPAFTTNTTASPT